MPRLTAEGVALTAGGAAVEVEEAGEGGVGAGREGGKGGRTRRRAPVLSLSRRERSSTLVAVARGEEGAAVGAPIYLRSIWT